MSERKENVFLLFIDLREVEIHVFSLLNKVSLTDTKQRYNYLSRNRYEQKEWKKKKKKKQPGAFSRSRCSHSLLVIEFLSKYSHSTSNSNPVHLSSPFFYSIEDQERKTDSQSRETHRWTNLRRRSIETSARPQLVKTGTLADKATNNIHMNKTRNKITGSGFDIQEEREGFRLIARLKNIRNKMQLLVLLPDIHQHWGVVMKWRYCSDPKGFNLSYTSTNSSTVINSKE